MSYADFQANRAKMLAEEEARNIQNTNVTGNLQTRLCPPNGIPPCQSGFISQTVKNSAGESTTCCLVDPNRNDPTKVQTLLKVAIEVGKNVLANEGVDLAVDIATQVAKGQFKYGPKALLEMAKRLQNVVTSKITSIFFNKAGKEVGEKVALQIGKEVTEKVGEKVAIKVGEKVVEKSTEAAAKMGAEAASEAAMGPIGWAMLAFDLFSLGLDLADPGGYSDITFLGDYKNMRDKTNDQFNNELIKMGMKTPVVVSPLNNLPQGPLSENTTKSEGDVSKSIIDIVSFIQTEYCLTYVENILGKVDISTLSSKEQSLFLEQILSDALKYFDTEKGKTYLNNRLCIIAGGLVNKDGICTYKDRASCDASYDWNKIKKSLSNTECTDCSNNYYAEFRDGQCVLTNPTLRTSCEDNGVAYDYDKQLCTITDTYCKSKGLDPISTPDGTDCKLKMGQEIAELIFGTTVTRGLKQVFDPAQYKPCKAGEHDGNNVPKTIQNLLYASIALPPPLSVPGILYATLGNKVCINPHGCQNGKEETAGLCYTPCKNEFKSDGAIMCYKQYPDFQNNGQGHTITSVTKKIITNTGRPLSTCSPDEEKNGLLCYPKCPDGMKGVGPVCWAETSGVGIGTPVELDDCPSGWTNDGLTCRAPLVWNGCKSRAYQWLGGGCIGGFEGGQVEGRLNKGGKCPSDREKIDGLCYKRCPPGSDHVPGMPYNCKKAGVPLSQGRGAGVPMKCAPGEIQKSAGLCYDACPSGYQDQSLGLCSQACPSGSKDFGVGCTREAYNRGAGTIPFSVYVKERAVPYGKK